MGYTLINSPSLSMMPPKASPTSSEEPTSSDPPQIFLHCCPGIPIPGYLLLVLDSSSDKLSKLTMAPPLPLDDPAPLLRRALTLLAHPPPPDLSLPVPWLG